MTIDPSVFFLHNALDTCSVWNVLSSNTIFSKAKEAGVTFCCTKYVEYECLIKKRTKPTIFDINLQKYLRELLLQGEFSSYELSLEDLQEQEVLSSRKRLGLGELSTLAFVKGKMLAFMSDDQKARKFASEILSSGFIQTTPHLVSWLAFCGHISESDKIAIIKDHEKNGGNISKYLEGGYAFGCQCRQMANPSQS
ncbi:MAG: hypothetical protein LBL38_03520 [Lactobacillales bacterium]|jgi:hypothetical protein|nr:hypothetical protein [Lactobacillales bacterium]